MNQLIVSKTFVIPANTPAGMTIAADFPHTPDKKYNRIFALGLSEEVNPNNIHYNFGLQVNTGTQTLQPTSKNFYLADGRSPLSERFTAIEFDKPSNEKSTVTFTPTTDSGATDIQVQVVFKYKQA